MHIEYDDFGAYVEVEDNGMLYAVGTAEDSGEQAYCISFSALLHYKNKESTL